jgi:hypothetical protein
MAPDFGRLARMPWARLLGILRHQALGLGLGLFVFEVSYRVRAKCKRIPARRWSRSYR